MNSRPDFQSAFLRGVSHFNACEFWEAHESWEQLWLAAESDLTIFLQGLIQLAAAYHHVKRGTLPGAVRLFDSALDKLQRFPMRYCGIDRAEAEIAARRDRAWARGVLERGVDESPRESGYPRLVLVNPSVAPMPPLDEW